MTAQPSSQAEREDVAREVLAENLRARGFDEAARGVLNGSVETMLLACLDAMLAFSDREHATPRSMPEEVVEAYERAAKVADELAAHVRSLMHPQPLPIDTNEGWRRVADGAEDIADTIRALLSQEQTDER